MAGSGALGRAQQPPGREPLDLLERRPGLVALGAGEVHDRAHAAQRVAKRTGVREVADRQLDAHALGAEAPRIAHQSADGLAPRGQAAQHGGPEQARGAGQQEHADTLARSARALPLRIRVMAYVIAEPCIGTKDNSCVEVCPVDCIHPTPDEPDYDKVEMLFIDPEECIDCDACVEACPVDACFAEDQLPDEWTDYAQKNAEYYAGR